MVKMNATFCSSANYKKNVCLHETGSMATRNIQLCVYFLNAQQYLNNIFTLIGRENVLSSQHQEVCVKTANIDCAFVTTQIRGFQSTNHIIHCVRIIYWLYNYIYCYLFIYALNYVFCHPFNLFYSWLWFYRFWN